MTDETGSPAGSEAISTALPADAPESFNSAAEAVQYLTDLEAKKAKPAESAETATADTESAARQDSDPETAPAEEPEGDDPDAEKLPPIERPRSWSKDDDDDWNALPRARQEKIAANDRARELEIRQRINEAAEQRKATQAEREAVEKVRQELEANVKSAKEILGREQALKFPEIKTWDDYHRLADEANRLSESDPFTSVKIGNYLKAFDAHNMGLKVMAQQEQEIASQKAQERQSKRAAYEAEQNKTLIELVPEMANPKKASELRDRAVAMLNDDLGLKNETLSRWMADDTGHEILSNAGIQKLIADRLKFLDIQNASKAVAAKPLPPVQKPGISKPAGSTASEREQALSRKTELTQKEGLELLGLQSARRQRRA